VNDDETLRTQGHLMPSELRRRSEMFTIRAASVALGFYNVAPASSLYSSPDAGMSSINLSPSSTVAQQSRPAAAAAALQRHSLALSV